MNMYDYIYAMLTDINRMYGHIPRILPILQWEWDQLYVDLGGVEGQWCGPVIRLTHSAGEVNVIYRISPLPDPPALTASTWVSEQLPPHELYTETRRYEG